MLIQLYPTAYFEKPPFPVRTKENAKVSTMVSKSSVRTPKLDEQIRVAPNITMVKYLLEEDVHGNVIYFCAEAARIAKTEKGIKIDQLLACLSYQLK